jgi:LDH2 family malate/lactate/ureidoglycolate dehydrogenase
MIMGILSSMLSGAAYGAELGDLVQGPVSGQDGHFLLALRVAAFEDVDTFKARVDQAIKQIHTCRLAPGFERIYAPGELEHLTRIQYQRDGIPLNEVTLADLARAGRQFGLETSFS